MLVTLPDILAVDHVVARNRIRQVGERQFPMEGALANFIRGRLQGFLFAPSNGGGEVLVLPKGKQSPAGYPRVLQAVVTPSDGACDLREGTWRKHPSVIRPEDLDGAQEIRRVVESWSGAFSYVQEDQSQGLKGLRNPQIGALHAVLAHWSVSDSPATIVMPTGTGKTDAMIAILVSVRCPRLLVLVPTDVLRAQLVGKFLTLGALRDRDCTVLGPQARYPLVGMLEHIPRSVDEVDAVFERCQVIVTTSQIAGQCPGPIQDRIASACPYLFIDEAHHTEAPTWAAFKEKFRGRRILQFTATPFREDGRLLDGDIIYKYPLKKAQEQGYFRPIRFEPVVEFNPSKTDLAIATKAIERLRADAAKGHVLMARVDGVERAKQVFELYRPHAEFEPVELHTGIRSQAARDAARSKILSGQSRIVVCVDMLGEGFDLPELKIAAFHDIRKSVAVTLQLAGRFTRARPGLGDACVIANVADVHVRDELRKLYTRDPDWNVLLPELSEELIGQQTSLQEFLRGFVDFPDEIPLKTVRPATSAVAYRTSCSTWRPEKFREGIPGLSACERVHHGINEQKNALVVVTARRVPLAWTDVESLFSWEWELYVVFWSKDQNLLFINSSTNAGEYRALARAIGGDDASLIRGQEVFRTFAGVHRLRLQNVGLTEQLGRNVRYTGRMGADVEPALSDVQRRRARKSVLSGTGYEGGKKTTVGASRKGRIWSHRRDHVDELAAWCQHIGGKLLDEGIDPDEILKGTLEAQVIGLRPHVMPIGIDWPEDIYKEPESTWWIAVGDREWGLAELSISLVEPSIDGPLRLEVASETDRVELTLELFDEGDNPNYRFVVSESVDVQVRHGQGAEGTAIADFLYESPPIVWFVDGSSLEGNQHVQLKTHQLPYDSAKIQAWDWSGVNLRKESQGQSKEPSSIQARVIRELKNRGTYAAIVDDDGKGEAADVVAVRVVGEPDSPTSIEVEFYHCKFSGESTPGQRIEDLYAVCGQAQKSISWASSGMRETDVFTHLLRREGQRRDAGRVTRIEVGDTDRLLTIREVSRVRPVRLSIYIVQPGLSKANATPDQLQLLSVTENHLAETYQLPFGVIGSP